MVKTSDLLKKPGMMRVQLGRYTYETDLPVEVGDVVLVPNPQWLQDVKGVYTERTVTSLTSDYKGPCVRIIRIVKKVEKGGSK